MKTHIVIIVAVVIVITTIGGMFATISIKNQREQAAIAKAKAKTEAKVKQQAEAEEKQRVEAEKVRAQKETELIRDLISKNSDFDVCRVCGVAFIQYENMNLTGFGRPDTMMDDCVAALHEAGYAQWPYVDHGYWKQTKKAEWAIQQGLIRESKEIASGRPTGHVTWRCVLGCRELQQVDATTQLSDGLKVDFSWHWKDTDIGTAAGLNDERHRGVAYFTRTANGLAIEQAGSAEVA